MIVDWVEGETASRDFILKEEDDGGVMTPFALTDLTVTLVLIDRTGAAVDTASDITVILPQTGTNVGRVRYTPDPTDIVQAKGDLRARFKVTDGGGAFGYFPRGAPDTWRVHKP